MGMFYQINFTAERQTRGRTLLVSMILLVLCLLAGAGVYAYGLWQEAQMPVLQPRLSRYQSVFEHVHKSNELWLQTHAAYQTIAPFEESRGQVRPCMLLGVVECLAAAEAPVSPSGVPYSFLPAQVSITRNEGMTISGIVKFPRYNKEEHQAATSAFLHEVVSNALAGAQCGLTNATFTWVWSKAALSVGEEQNGLTLALKLPAQKQSGYPAPPPELAAAVKDTDVWRGKVHKSLLAANPGSREKKRETGVWLNELVTRNREALGEQYDAVKRLSERAVDPLAVVRALREHGGDKVGGDAADFENAWMALSMRQFKRERTLDNLELDLAVLSMERLAAALPRRDDFDAGLARVEAQLNSFTNATLKKHVDSELTFWERVLEPSVKRVKTPALAVRQDGKIEVDAKAARVDFPVWKLVVADGSSGPGDKKAETDTASLKDLKAILLNIETNSSGTWVTQTAAVFQDDSTAAAGPRWNALHRIRVEGRVPCWLGSSK